MAEEKLVKRGYKVMGRVQGVFFRVWTQQTARDLGLRGTVQNRADGSVEAHALGTAEVLELFEARLWTGPDTARVVAVEVNSSDADIPQNDFEIRY